MTSVNILKALNLGILGINEKKLSVSEPQVNPKPLY